MDSQVGVVYLGFFLNPNYYSKNGWNLSIENIEKWMWCNKWPSLGGRLARVKSVLEAIIVYWNTTAYIPKKVLEIQK